MAIDSNSNPKNESASQSSDAWRRVVLENALDAVVGMDADGLIIDWNRQAEVVFGWTKSHATGKRLSEVIIPHEYRAAHEKGMNHFLATGEGPILNQRIEITALHRNGSVFPVELTVIPIREGGRFIFYSFVRDITDRMEARKAIEHSSILLKAVIEGIADAVFVKDRAGKYTIINQAGAAMLGRTPDEIIGRDDTELFPKEVAEKIMADDQKVMKTGEATVFEDEIRSKGIVFSSKKSAFRDSQGKLVGVIGVARDISEKKAAEESLRESEQRFRTLFEQAPFSVQLLSPEARTLRVNRAWAELWQIPQEVVDSYILKDYDILNDPQLEKKGILPYLRKGFNGESTPIPAIHYDPQEMGFSGRARWVEAFIHPIKDRLGGVHEVMLIHNDVTERHQYESERERLVAELREAVRARDEFLSIASHELKTPLTSLNLQVQIRKRNLEKGHLAAFTPDKLDDMLSSDYRQLKRLTRLIEGMLDISRINTGNITLQPEKVDLCTLVNEVVERLRPEIEAGGSALTLHHCGSISGEWDPIALEQVVSNLLSNASKYGNRKPIEVALKRDGDKAVLRVTDHGIGIPEEKRERIFQRFERAISATEISGLGLGLYIVRKIVQMHGGTVRVQSEMGDGSTFIVELPITR